MRMVFEREYTLCSHSSRRDVWMDLMFWGACGGCWCGAMAIPLDWDRWWQVRSDEAQDVLRDVVGVPDTVGRRIDCWCDCGNDNVRRAVCSRRSHTQRDEEVEEESVEDDRDARGGLY